MRRLFALLTMGVLATASFGAGAVASLALFTDQEATQSVFSSGTWGSSSATIGASPRDIRDASTGSEVNVSDPYSFAGDGVTHTTGNWPSSFSSTRYMQWDYNTIAPAGLSVTSATFTISLRPNVGPETACFYIEVRRASTNALISSNGSSGSPYACATGSTLVTYNVALTGVSTTDIANDLRIKLFATESNVKPIHFDAAIVAAVTSAGTFTYFERVTIDAATTSPVTTPWSLATVDGTFYQNGSSWPTSFSATRYLLFTVHPSVPTGATVSAASLTNVYQSATSGPTTCYYFEVWSGGSLLATHGSSSSPVSCHTGNSSWTTATTSLPSLTTAAQANGVKIKMFFRSSGSNRSRQDQLRLDLTYSY